MDKFNYISEDKCPQNYMHRKVRVSFIDLFYCLFKIVDAITDVSIPPSFVHLHPALPLSLWPSPHCCLCLWVMHIWSLAHPFTFFHAVLPFHLPSDSCQPVPCIHASVSILFISLFCSLDK